MQNCFAIDKLQQLLKQSPEGIIIVDVRSPEEFLEKHIPDAINIPLDELTSCSLGLPRQALIITVCAKGGGRSQQAATLLTQRGFISAGFLCGGTYGWYTARTQ